MLIQMVFGHTLFGKIVFYLCRIPAQDCLKKTRMPARLSGDSRLLFSVPQLADRRVLPAGGRRLLCGHGPGAREVLPEGD